MREDNYEYKGIIISLFHVERKTKWKFWIGIAHFIFINFCHLGGKNKEPDTEKNSKCLLSIELSQELIPAWH